MNLATAGIVEQHEEVTAQPNHKRIDYLKDGIGGDSCVHCIAASLEQV
jgi:hypothetical protein